MYRCSSQDMDIPLKTIILLALCVLVNSATSHPSIKQAPLGNEKIQKIVSLNVTICVPPSATKNTKIISSRVDETSISSLVFYVQAQRSETNASCTDTTKDGSCKTSPEEPELTVMLFKEMDSGNILLCSTNVTDENLKVIIDAEGSEIIVRSNKTKGARNTATVTIQLLASSINYLELERSFSIGRSILAVIEQTWEPTTTISSSAVSTTFRATRETSTGLNEKTSESTETTVHHPRKGSSPRPETTTTTTVSMGESSLCRGPLSGLVLLVLLPMLLYY
ncbi:uncharacterized protein LOC130291690 isoform X2 [Hyla sarda]|uniref:uncharacterized protein LOC130291690 isoform X2 n=1 Tax=Hyla sarda TaxID=327740 RepID=UPI0024C3C847|nr:uncharacterized protein LOC130291690 isoform X2 [Hyla sarda]